MITDFKDHIVHRGVIGRKPVSQMAALLMKLMNCVMEVAGSRAKRVAEIWIIIFLQMLPPTVMHAQETLQSPLKGSEYGRYYIKSLKDHGALIVRLNYKTKAINALMQSGNSNYANQIRYQQAEENSMIMQAFRKYYSFSPVYFISYDSTTAFIEGRRSSIFLDSELKIDSSIHTTATFFLFAEIGTLETPVAVDKLQPEQESAQRGLMDEVLVIRNTDLSQLHDPFPYYVQRPSGWEGRVKKLEKKFQQYYLRSK